MASPLLTIVTIVGFVDGQPDLVYASNGFHVIVAYVTGARGSVQVGQVYNVYKQNSTYMLGAKIQGQ
jgi:hypothetical protein